MHETALPDSTPLRFRQTRSYIILPVAASFAGVLIMSILLIVHSLQGATCHRLFSFSVPSVLSRVMPPHRHHTDSCRCMTSLVPFSTARASVFVWSRQQENTYRSKQGAERAVEAPAPYLGQCYVQWSAMGDGERRGHTGKQTGEGRGSAR